MSHQELGDSRLMEGKYKEIMAMDELSLGTEKTFGVASSFLAAVTKIGSI